MIRPIDEYPGKVEPVSSQYPDGKARNISAPGDGTGTPLEAKWLNDLFGVMQYVTSKAGITPSGTPENAETSQVFEGLWTLLNARVLTFNLTADANYTLTADQNLYKNITITDTGVVLTTGRDIIVDDVGRIFLFTNSTAQTLTVKTAAGTGVDVGAGDSLALVCDETNVVSFSDFIGDTGAITASSVLGYKNSIINGDFKINQRGYISGAATSGANEYTLDRWRVVTSGQSLTWSDTNGKRTVTAPAGGIEQVIEGQFLQGGTFAISFEGSATVSVDGTPRTNGETFSITGGINVIIKVAGGTCANIQLERNTVATAFEQIPTALALSLCHRYYQEPVTALSFWPAQDKASALGTIEGVFNVATYGKMRTTPTVVATNFKYSQDSGTPVSFTPNVLNADDVGISLGDGSNHSNPAQISISGEKLTLDAEL